MAARAIFFGNLRVGMGTSGGTAAALLTQRRPNWLLAAACLTGAAASPAEEGRHLLGALVASFVETGPRYACRPREFEFCRAPSAHRAQDFGYGDKADGEGDNGDGELITDHDDRPS
jgi:hypothetical protein